MNTLLKIHFLIIWNEIANSNRTEGAIVDVGSRFPTGEDSDPVARERRNKILEVRSAWYTLI